MAAGAGERTPLLVWAVVCRPRSGGAWELCRNDDEPVTFSDKPMAQRYADVKAEQWPDYLYQALPMEGRPPADIGSEGGSDA